MALIIRDIQRDISIAKTELDGARAIAARSPTAESGRLVAVCETNLNLLLDALPREHEDREEPRD